MSMSAFDDNQPEKFPSTPEGNQEVLIDARQAIINDAFGRHDEAMAREEIEGLIYIAEAPLDTPHEEATAILLTPDGRRPFKTEEDTKEQIWVIQVKGMDDIIWFHVIENGKNEHFSLSPDGFSPVVDVNDMESEIADSFSQTDPTEEEMRQLVQPINPVSTMRRMLTLRDKVSRYPLTPLQDPPVRPVV